jgi:hypothetical protein
MRPNWGQMAPFFDALGSNVGSGDPTSQNCVRKLMLGQAIRLFDRPDITEKSWARCPCYKYYFILFLVFIWKGRIIYFSGMSYIPNIAGRVIL